MSPQRIQRRRTKGWRMPEGAVYVGRPTRWGNPFKVGEDTMAVSRKREPWGCTPETAEQAVSAFRRYIEERIGAAEAIREGLAGRDLACWCPLDQPCHADVLLEVAADNDGHRPDDDMCAEGCCGYCVTCGYGWPCPSVSGRALTAGEVPPPEPGDPGPWLTFPAGRSKIRIPPQLAGFVSDDSKEQR